MPTLPDLPEEVLQKVLDNLLADSYKEDYRAFGAGLRNLSLVCKRLSQAVDKYRYYDWELVSEGPFTRLKRHLELEAWRDNVKLLTVPLLDLRAPQDRQAIGLKEYDETLASVVASARALKRISIVFFDPIRAAFSDDTDWVDDHINRSFLPRTASACMARAEVSHLEFLGVTSVETCRHAIGVINGWPNLKHLSIKEGLGVLLLEEQSEVYFDLLEVSTQRNGLDKLELDVPFLEDLDSGHARTIAPFGESLKEVTIGRTAGMLQEHKCRILYDLLQQCGNLTKLSVWLSDLLLAASLRLAPIRLGNLCSLHLYVHSTTDTTSNRPTFDTAVDDFYTWFDNFERLEAIHVSGPGKAAFVSALLDHSLPDSLQAVWMGEEKVFSRHQEESCKAQAAA